MGPNVAVHIRTRKQRGYSIVELMAVVGLITISSAIAFSTLMPYGEEYRVKGAAFMLAAELQKARMDAVRTRLCHFFDRTSQTQFRIVRDNPAVRNCTLGADDTVLRTVSMGSQFLGVRMDQGGVEIDPFGGAVTAPSPSSMRFEPRGVVTTVGGSSVFLMSDNFGPWAVTVTAAGGVRTWRKTGSAWS